LSAGKNQLEHVGNAMAENGRNSVIEVRKRVAEAEARLKGDL